MVKSAGSEVGNRSPASTRSVSEIISSIQRSKIGIQDWTLSDLTLGLYLLYLRQTSADPIEDVKGVQISSDSIVATNNFFLFLNSWRDIWMLYTIVVCLCAVIHLCIIF